MSKIIIYKSNSLEKLADKYYETLSENMLPVMLPEPVIMQSIGMGRWLSLYMAEKSGIWANFNYLFPNAFVKELSEKFFQKSDNFNVINSKQLCWLLMKIIPELSNKQEFNLINNYIKDSQLRQYQLALQISDTFDQYTIYRPEMIRSWNAGEDVVYINGKKEKISDEYLWQPILWRFVKEEAANYDRSELQQKLLTTINSTDNLEYKRISVFGVSTLPVYHVELLSALSNKIPVYMFLLSPTYHYWEDIVSNKYKAILDKKAFAKNIHPNDYHHEQTNSLLASMGKLGQDFFSIMSGINVVEPTESVENQMFVDQGTHTILSSIQSSILHLRNRSTDKNLFDSGEKFKINPNDKSVMIQNCHSPMREVEVLYDQLLNIFETQKDISPKDILVMVPDIDEYASYIEAVFGTPESEKSAIPFSIADRNLRKQSRIAEAMINILMLKDTNFSVVSVIDILTVPEVRQKFYLSDDDVEKISEWLMQSGIRWGLDKHDRKKNIGVEFEQNSWKYGLERILLGYAAYGNNNDLFDNILPFDNIEGNDAEKLGEFYEFITIIFDFFNDIEKKHTVNQWGEILLNLLDSVFQITIETKWEFDVIRKIIDEFVNTTSKVNYNKNLDFDVVSCHLQNSLDADPIAFGFLTGKVTFCAMLPMRSIPFKVVAMIGMNDGTYPRMSRKVGFDIIGKYSQLGDRSQRNDDRYLFLESVLSARKILYLSFIGKSIKDNSAYPPSVLVSEFIDYISQNYIFENDDEENIQLVKEKIYSHLVTEHRLQAFNDIYFNESNKKYFSYSNEYCQAALAVNNINNQKFFNNEVKSDVPVELLNITLEHFISFFNNPSKYLLNNRFKIYLPTINNKVNDKEQFEDLDFIDKLQMEERMLREMLDSQSKLDQLEKIYTAAGLLPPQNIGNYVYKSYQQEIEKFSGIVKPYLDKEIVAHDEFTLQFDIAENKKIFLNVNFSNLRKSGILKYRNNMWSKDKISLWINHLILNTIDISSIKKESIFISRKEKIIFKEIDNAGNILKQLVEIYYSGLKFPIKFFPKISEAYAENLLIKNKSKEIALLDSIKLWENERVITESSDEYVQLAFRNESNLLDDEFEKIATQIYKPFYKHIQVGGTF